MIIKYLNSSGPQYWIIVDKNDTYYKKKTLRTDCLEY